MSRPVAVIVGATGFIGARLAAHLTQTGRWNLIGLCRNASVPSAIPLMSVRLTDAQHCRETLAGLSQVTHVLYAARNDHPEGVPESIEINAAMLRNVVEAIAGAAPGLRHVHAVHGTKYYGHNLGPIPVPAHEDGPRASVANFYFAQEDYLREGARQGRWSWSTSRPHIFCDYAPGTARNLPLLIGVYASLLRESGQPLIFPGTEASYRARTQFTDLSMLARAIDWMTTDPRGSNQAYNVVNGDAPCWSELWAGFAAYFGMAVGPVVPARVGDVVAGMAPVWQSLVQRHQLHTSTLADLVLWPYGDYVFRPEWDIVSDMQKARKHGFADRLDSLQQFVSLFDHMRAERIIP